MTIQELLKQHGEAVVFLTAKNTNGTAWLYSAYSKGALAKYQVLIRDSTPQAYADGVTLSDLHSQTDILEVSVDGVTVY